jgi:hypothetical protein
MGTRGVPLPVKLENKNRIPKERPKWQNYKCCRLGLIEYVHRQYWKLQATVIGLTRIQHFKVALIPFFRAPIITLSDNNVD